MSIVTLVSYDRPMEGAAPQLPGKGAPVSVSTRWFRGQLKGSLAGAGDGSVSVKLNPSRARLLRGTRVELAWVEPKGLARLRGRVRRTRPLLEIGFRKPPELVKRREHVRAPVIVAITAWTPRDPTRRLSGTTIDLGADGALLHLPETSEAATTLDVTVALPGAPLTVTGRIVRREGERIAIDFDGIARRDRERLTGFVLARLSARPPDVL